MEKGVFLPKFKLPNPRSGLDQVEQKQKDLGNARDFGRSTASTVLFVMIEQHPRVLAISNAVDNTITNSREFSAKTAFVRRRVQTPLAHHLELFCDLLFLRKGQSVLGKQLLSPIFQLRDGTRSNSVATVRSRKVTGLRHVCKPARGEPNSCRTAAAQVKRKWLMIGLAVKSS